jgi:hypothetical protein
MGIIIEPVASIRRIRGQVRHGAPLLIMFGENEALNTTPPKGLKWTVEITVNVKEQNDNE